MKCGPSLSSFPPSLCRFIRVLEGKIKVKIMPHTKNILHCLNPCCYLPLQGTHRVPLKQFIATVCHHGFYSPTTGSKIMFNIKKKRGAFTSYHLYNSGCDLFL